ncbi:MAG: tRNA (guanosine(46)-N7)-methyltransferase TrmB [Parachlamydia sp.]|nr:tRNA (guanosine(46)-N7)-methyltransferase TrmB [Parachlamydia sp.]
MKPKDLIPPFTQGCSQVIIEDRIWYLPELCTMDPLFRFPGWEDEKVFPSKQPVFIEYCSGNGHWIVEKARQFPHFNWVAVEIKFDRIRKIWSKIKNHALDNLFVINGEGFRTTAEFLTNESIEGVYINFPDPWPKKKHTKNRIIQPRFVNEIYRILKKGSHFTFVTDDENFSDFSLKVMETVAGFESVLNAPYYVHEYPGYGSSCFEDLWRQKGKSIRYHVFKKN